MNSSRKMDQFINDYDQFEYESADDFSSKKKKRLDPYNKGKERRNSKINPRFIEIDEDNVDFDHNF